ncbi:MAG TPA: hypothetical protein VFA09_19290 [Ktedonobacteraceae bacterium]|jgi:hypothetical protein|nr:hypothetical protein [Ktedonobacteraceae bacterium]
MIKVERLSQPLRLSLTGSMLICGFIAAALLLHQGNFASASAVFAIGLAALVGAGKLASP